MPDVGDVPGNFKKVGFLAPTAGNLAVPARVGAWEYAALQRIGQWPPVDEALSARKLTALAKRRWFTEWRGSVDKAVLEAARQIIAKLVAGARAKRRTGLAT